MTIKFKFDRKNQHALMHAQKAAYANLKRNCIQVCSWIVQFDNDEISRHQKWQLTIIKH